MDVVKLAYQIIAMDRELQALRVECERLREYKQKYSELLASSLTHSEAMIDNIVDILLNPDKYRLGAGTVENTDHSEGSHK